jgi:hypothetical protein
LSREKVRKKKETTRTKQQVSIQKTTASLFFTFKNLSFFPSQFFSAYLSNFPPSIRFNFKFKFIFSFSFTVEAAVGARVVHVAAKGRRRPPQVPTRRKQVRKEVGLVPVVQRLPAPSAHLPAHGADAKRGEKK